MLATISKRLLIAHPGITNAYVRRVVCMLVFLCFVNSTFCQQTIIMDETFDNNNNNWKVFSDSNFKVKIEGGLLHLQKYEKNRINKSCLWYKKEIPNFNTSTDFSITFYAKVLSTDDLFNLVDLQWGFRNAGEGSINRNDSLFQVEFVMDGQVRLNYFDKKWNHLKWINSTDTAKTGDPTWRKDRNTRYVYPYKSEVFNKYEIIQK
ncbi:MAG: hypothetical protein JWQ96_2809, partial [Segetibacter sp.]|nr:hypothetical protein [Segetibacter sp.]